MPTRPQVYEMTASTVDILNAIRNGASQNYRDYVPPLTGNEEQFRSVGNIIMQYEALQNDFLHALYNRISLVLLTSKMYSNPLNIFKKGVLDMGEVIEEIFVALAQPFEFDSAKAESEVFKREIPDVRSAFHYVNYHKFYKSTISEEQLRKAFLSFQEMDNLIAGIVNSLYSSAAYDEFLAMKYLVAKMILDGRIYPVSVGTVQSSNMKSIVSKIKKTSNAFEFMSPDYNIAGVENYALKDTQYILVNSEFDATMDVEVLASAFNMSKADFVGRRILVDSFGSFNMNRLNKLFEHDANYHTFTSAELAALDAVPAVLVDSNWFMIYDNLNKFTENYNGQGLYWNYFYHQWKTFSISPFHNAAVFVPTTPTIKSVTVSPSTLSLSPSTTGAVASFTATVDTDGTIAPKTVTWSVSIGDNDEGISITQEGVLTIASNYKSALGSITVTATSTYNSAKTGTATVTVPSTNTESESDTEQT